MNAETRGNLAGKFSSMALPKPVFFCFVFYIATLAATQTVYGLGYLTLRWVALGTLTLVSFVYWFLGRAPEKNGGEVRHDPVLVFVYLGATILSLPTAENFEFSGLRWMTQGMLILSCMAFLRGTFNPGKMEDLLLALKVISLILLIISFAFPTSLGLYDSPYFRGAMGDSNSFGHVSAICALVYLQGVITARSKNWRIVQFVVAALATIMLIRSGARSSMLAFLIGFILTNYYFGLTRSLLRKGFMFLVIAFLLASPGIREKVGGFIAKEERERETQSRVLALGMYFKSGVLPEFVFASRERLWSEAWEGFSERPFLGWGFGATANIPKEWTIGPTGYGVTRDLTNDLLFILEGTGIVGFLGYLALMISILSRSPTRQEILMVQKSVKKESPSPSLKGRMDSLKAKAAKSMAQKSEGPGKNEDAKIMGNWVLAKAYAHSQMYILSVSLFVLFLFDGSAFSAGSLISAIFWISAGAANLTGMEWAADRRRNRREFLIGSRRPGIQGLE